LKKILELIVILVIALIFYRLTVHLIIWKYIWMQFPPPQTVLQYTARIIYSLLDILQVVTIAAAIRLLRLRLEAIKKEKHLQREKMHAELMQLKAQVNPHFLFNSLNSIYSLARNRSELTAGVVMKLSGILRYMLYRNNDALSPIADEFRLIDDYLELQHIRFGEKRKVILKKETDADEILIPPLLLLPLLENIYKHGATDAGPAYCSIIIRNSIMKVTTINPYRNSVPAEAGSGIGLNNIRRQLELMYTDFHLHSGLVNDEFKVELTINLNSYAGDELFDSRG
jgi:two-component system LytT family sensor kinase